MNRPAAAISNPQRLFIANCPVRIASATDRHAWFRAPGGTVSCSSAQHSGIRPTNRWPVTHHSGVFHHPEFFNLAQDASSTSIHAARHRCKLRYGVLLSGGTVFSPRQQCAGCRTYPGAQRSVKSGGRTASFGRMISICRQSNNNKGCQNTQKMMDSDSP